LWYQRAGYSDWRYGIELEVYFFLAGEMHYVAETDSLVLVKAPPVQLSYDSPLSERISFRVEVPFQKRLTELMSVCVFPWFEFGQFGKSDTRLQWVWSQDGGVYEPRLFHEPQSATFWIGLGLDVVFHTRQQTRFVAMAVPGTGFW
jgi:hypothetical protein